MLLLSLRNQDHVTKIEFQEHTGSVLNLCGAYFIKDFLAAYAKDPNNKDFVKEFFKQGGTYCNYVPSIEQ